MIGVAGQDLLSPVDLLHQHAANQEMRPRRATIGDNQVAAGNKPRAESIGAANEKCDLAMSGIAPIA